MTITELIKHLQDMVLLYGDKVILTITDGKNEYLISDINGYQCAKRFEPVDNVSEIVIKIRKK